jgi:two-component system, OmpR family, sensor kinase
LRRIDQDLERHLMALMRPGPPEPPQGRFPGATPGEPPDTTPGRDSSPRRPRPMEQGRFGEMALPDNPGPPPDGPREERRFDSPDFLLRMRGMVQQGGVLDSSQTNTFYYILWQADGSILARSPGAPAEVPPPIRPDALVAQTSRLRSSGEPQGFNERDASGKGPPAMPGPALQPEARTRGQIREAYRFLPRGHCLLVGRSLAPDLAAMRRLALWLTAAGAAVLLLGLAGGWWIATRAIRPVDEISATAVRIADGDLSQRISAADTDSELGRLAGVLNSTFARLEAAFAQQARFTSDASHELRTPVSVILSQTQTALSRERSSPEYKEALEACQRAARRMKALTESLLELARLDAGQAPMKKQRFDLPAAIKDWTDLLRPLAAERGIQIHCDVPPMECLGDAERLGQVMTNLLTNAIHFNREQGEIRLSARVENETIVLTVADTGQGIPAEDIPHLFERFYRVDKSRSRIQGRNGLGLAICKAIVDAHGGTLQVASQTGVGTTFTVSLPLT